jgi:putative ABC transport system ATP-binding protein
VIELQLEGISKRFSGPDGGLVTALDNLSLTIPNGEFLVVVGPNGAGKSTLMKLLSGRERASSGTITAVVDGKGQDWTIPTARTRRQIGQIRQDPVAGTVDELTVGENLRFASLAAIPIPFRTALSEKWRKRAIDLLDPTALARKTGALASELSHGQRQLLALEMAAARSVQLLLLDEPTASLDRKNADFCMRRVEDLRKGLTATVLLVTHDMSIAAAHGDRLVVLRDGRIAADLAKNEKADLRPEDVFKLSGF